MDGLVVQLDHAGRGQRLEQRIGLAAGDQCLRGPLGVLPVQRDAAVPGCLAVYMAMSACLGSSSICSAGRRAQKAMPMLMPTAR